MQNLMEHAKKGKRAALNELYEKYWKEVKFISSALLMKSEDASQAVVRAFQNTWNGLSDGSIQTEEEFRNKLLSEAVTYCRRKSGKKSLPLPPNKNFMVSKQDINLTYGENNVLDSVLQCLPIAGRFIFVLHQIAGFSQKEIAAFTGINEKTVGFALEAESKNIESIFAVVSQNSGDYSRKASELLEEAIFSSKQEAELSDLQKKQIQESIDTFAAPFEKKQKKKIIISTSAVLIAAAILGVILWWAASGGTKEKQENSVETTESLEEGTEAIQTSHYAEISIQDYGTITVALDKDAAPQTVENFISLAESGFYDGLTFHRIMEGFMMQGGDPNGDGTGGSETTITGEFTENGFENTLSHTRGAISMARSADYNSASSQFFIVHQDSTQLDGQYAVFGYVTEGMDIVDEICSTAEPTDDNGTISADKQPVITSIRISEA